MLFVTCGCVVEAFCTGVWAVAGGMDGTLCMGQGRGCGWLCVPGWVTSHACNAHNHPTPLDDRLAPWSSQVAGASMAELMATFCDNLLKKVCAGRRPLDRLDGCLAAGTSTF